MATNKNQNTQVKQLKKKVKLLGLKEAKHRNELKAALKKLRKLGRAYKSKLMAKVRVMKGKVAEIQASTYAKVAADLERKLISSIETKTKAIASAVEKIEKKHVNKLARKVAKKAKNTKKNKPMKKAKKANKKSHGRKKVKKVVRSISKRANRSISKRANRSTSKRANRSTSKRANRSTPKRANRSRKK